MKRRSRSCDRVSKFGAILLFTSAIVAYDRPRVALAQANNVNGNQPQAITKVRFEIPAGQVGQALTAWAEAASLRIVASDATLRGRRTDGVRGLLAPEQALQQILSGTGLEYAASDRRTITISDPSDAALSARAQSVALPTIDVQGAGGAAAESPTGPVEGFVATRTETGTKTNASVMEIPQSISIVTRDQMTVQGAQTLEQALTYTPGVFVGIYGSNPEQDYVFSRGFLAPLFVDGVRQYKDFIVGAQLGFEPYGFERIEVLRGPASVLYGQVAPGGIVNMISKRPTETAFKEMLLQTGNRNRYQGAFDIGGPVDNEGKLLYRLTALGRVADGQMDFQSDDRLFIAPAFTWKPNIDTKWTFLSQFQSDRGQLRPVPLPAQGTLFPNPNGHLPPSRFLGQPSFDAFKRDQYILGYEFEHRLNDVWTVKQNLQYSQVNQLEKTSLPLFDAAFLLDQRTVEIIPWDDRNKIGVFGVDNQLHANLQTGPFSHKLLLGLDYSRVKSEWKFAANYLYPTIDAFDPNYTNPYAPLNPSIDDTRRQTQTGIYAQDIISLDRLRITLGGRYDWAEGNTISRLSTFYGAPAQENEAFTYRAGAAYLFDNGLAPYASYSTSFEPTVGADAYGRQFVPTTGQQAEVGIKYQPPGQKSFVGVSLFDLTKQNVQTRDPSVPPFTPNAYVQIGEVQVKGLEVEAKGQVTEAFSIISAYTYLDSEITKSNNDDLGRPLTFTPKEQFSLWGDYEVKQGPLTGLGFGAGVRFRGPIWGLNYEFETPSVTLVDASIRYDLANLARELKGYSFSIAARNLLDREYVSNCSYTEGCFYGDRRTILATLKFRQ